MRSHHLLIRNKKTVESLVFVLYSYTSKRTIVLLSCSKRINRKKRHDNGVLLALGYGHVLSQMHLCVDVFFG